MNIYIMALTSCSLDVFYLTLFLEYDHDVTMMNLVSLPV